ncbi:outer membrane beta-barrel protein [Variovorax terrae]|uniref:Outer membrane beta-barrel protein n=1 Tax=Variovorax terrae TaxID=2923278 RepID=A0A9X1VXI5_9BURK|nr:outer membrane beta-barrel protein [Variovorax terrae]MCJ0763904.1 outer membrane beta-barrel protein [Variovorax terrae]
MKKQLIGMVLCTAGGSALAAVADDVKSLLEKGQPRQAYELGKASPGEMGQPLFDFYFGIAALDAGAPGEGVLALERYALLFPDNRSARYQLARGYYILGEDQRAREEFTGLVAGSTGQELDAINKFLDAIRARESRYQPTASAYVELGLGTDSNINAGPPSGQVSGLPLGVVIAPGDSAEKESAGFSTLAAGAQGTYPVAPGVALYGGVGATGRLYQGGGNSQFDQRSLALQGGVSVIGGRNLYRFGIDWNKLTVDNQNYLSLTTLVGEWQYQNDQFNRFGLSAQWSDLNYDNILTYLTKNKSGAPVLSATDERDSRLATLTGFWTRSLVHPWNPVLNLSLNAGRESNRRNRDDLSRNLWGGRVSLSAQPRARWTVAGGLSYQNSRYAREFAVGAPHRQDDFCALDLAVIYAVDRNWSVRGEYQYTDQRSNIGFYQYDRDVLAVKLRYDFK